MKLEDLKREMPFKWRVQSANKWGASCVAYIDARDVQDLLDEVVGQANWQVKYEEHKNNMFCSIGINIQGGANIGIGTWIWKFGNRMIGNEKWFVGFPISKHISLRMLIDLKNCSITRSIYDDHMCTHYADRDTIIKDH